MERSIRSKHRICTQRHSRGPWANHKEHKCRLHNSCRRGIRRSSYTEVARGRRSFRDRKFRPEDSRYFHTFARRNIRHLRINFRRRHCRLFQRSRLFVHRNRRLHPFPKEHTCLRNKFVPPHTPVNTWTTCSSRNYKRIQQTPTTRPGHQRPTPSTYASQPPRLSEKNAFILLPKRPSRKQKGSPNRSPDSATTNECAATSCSICFAPSSPPDISPRITMPNCGSSRLNCVCLPYFSSAPTFASIAQSPVFA